ncbi:cytochrome P450 [Phanerochaete sordida]|uniref:Cytochrome P450 n=1 Tax=Phanerochaete sordida TaxID=48140 RepID=A0A9P3GUV1_9APHY|nr:cytochrome P450 [Phanerochaete sordida]
MDLLTALYSGAAALGLLTWLALNRRSVPGDKAAALYLLALAALYAALQRTSALTPHAFGTACGLAATYACAALGATAAYRLSPWHPCAHFPGPRVARVSSLWLSYVSFRGRRHLLLDALHARHGVFVRIGPNIVSINAPDAQHIYSQAARMPKADSYRAPGHDGVVALFFKQDTEKTHSERKRVWSGLFTKEGMAQLAPYIERRTWQLLACLERRQAASADKSVNLADAFYHMSYDLMGDFVFGGCNRLEMMKNGDPRGMIKGGKLATILLDSVGQTPWLLDIVWRLPLGRAMHRLTELAAELMENRLRVTEPPAFRDLVSFLTEDGSIPEKDLHLEAIVAIQGGSDNTSITMTLATYFITTSPHYTAALRAELAAAFPDPTGPLPDAQLAALPLLDACIHEALRLGSPYFLPRVVPAPGAHVAGAFLPPGAIVASAAYSQQVSPEHFAPDPLAFRPERWLPGGAANRGALASFSSGPHVCIARALAFTEMRHVLARLVLNMDVAPAPGFDARAFREGILNMRTTILEKPFVVRVKRRADAVPVDDA